MISPKFSEDIIQHLLGTKFFKFWERQCFRPFGFERLRRLSSDLFVRCWCPHANMKRLFVLLSEIMVMAFNCENAAQDHPAEKHAISRFHCKNKTEMNISTQIGPWWKWMFLLQLHFQTGAMQTYLRGGTRKVGDQMLDVVIVARRAPQGVILAVLSQFLKAFGTNDSTFFEWFPPNDTFLTYFLTCYLAVAFYLIYFCNSFWHSIWYIFGDSLWLRSGGQHSDHNFRWFCCCCCGCCCCCCCCCSSLLFVLVLVLVVVVVVVAAVTRAAFFSVP